MHIGIRGFRRLCLLVVAALMAAALTACGSSSSTTSGSSGSAQSLLQQTFSSRHTVRSGVLGLALTLRPTGSSTISTPVSLTFAGPFQSRGSGKLPQSDFTIGVSALGRHGSIGVISTGTAGYVTLEGSNYQLPPAAFRELESSFASTGSSSSGGLGQFGINPENWLKNPTVVGTETVDGTPTTHIRAGVDVSKLIADLNTLLKKTARTTATAAIPTQIPQSDANQIAAAVTNAGVDVWTGKSDSTLRRLAVNLTVPVTGRISTELGGMTSAGIGLTVSYTNLNQTQTISAPADVRPYSELTAKLQSIGQQLEGVLAGGALGSASSSGSGSGSGTAPSSSGGSAATVSKYSTCIEKANGDVTKMQKCASLLKAG